MGELRGRWKLLGLLTVVLSVLAFAAPASASYKPYTLVISPSSMGAGTATTTATATFTNENTAGQNIGSANLYWPTGFALTNAIVPAGSTATISQNCKGGIYSGPCIQLRNMNVPAGGTYTVTMTLQAPCVQTANTWKIEAKQSNDFSGLPGNDLNLDTSPGSVTSITTNVTGQCSLAFDSSGQPHGAIVNAAISNTDYTPEPTGGPVQIDVLAADGTHLGGPTVPTILGNIPVTMAIDNNPGGGTLSGTTQVSTQNAIATFSTLNINKTGIGYTMMASSPGFASSPASSSFDIQSTDAPCPKNVQCKTSVNGNNGSGTVTGNNTTSGSGLLIESANITTAQLECPGYTSLDGSTYVYFTTVPGGMSEVVTLVIKPPASTSGSANTLLKAQQICFGVPTSAPDFTTNAGTPAGTGPLPDGTTGYVGLLPDCVTVPNGPCHDRSSDNVVRDKTSPTGYDLVLYADIPPAWSTDPWTR